MEKEDITPKVAGKFEQGEMNLYLDKTKIGKITMTNQGNLYEMSEGFEFDSNKVYRKQTQDPTEVKAYVEGCDMGWC
jgi:hypothetical protein